MSDLGCKDNELRREDVRKTTLYGLDFVDVDDSQLVLNVFFLGKAPDKIEAANVRITGGRSITNIFVASVTLTHQKDATLDDFLVVELENYGDFSTYTLSLVKTDKSGAPTDVPMDGFDPLYATVDFSFKASCPSDLDCKPAPACPPELLPAPEINYLAKDYASFRQLMLDRLALTLPDWNEAHVPDIGITLVELLAYAGDYLSYYQDAVATEAYLGTARQRISVRRHARLVDYTMHEGCNARTFVTVATDTDAPLYPLQTWFCTSFPGAPDNRVLQPDDIAKAPLGSYEVFAPLVADPTKPIQLYKAHTAISFYSWGNQSCCLAKGATSATLTDTWVAPAQPDPPPAPPTPPAPPVQIDPTRPPIIAEPIVKTAAIAAPVAVAVAVVNLDSVTGEPPNMVRALNLSVGDVLIFEEVIGPKTGNPADANPKHRQAVRLTKVTRAVDPLYHPYTADYGQPIVEIEWCSEDALTFPLCLSAVLPAPDCTLTENISVARGNVILVDNSAPTGETIGTVGMATSVAACSTDCAPSETITTPTKFRPKLTGQPLTFSQPMPACGCACQALPQDPRQALPRITLAGTLQTPQGSVVTNWTAKADLLESGPNDNDFVVEMDDSGIAHLRFGNGSEGYMPDAGTVFTAAYSLGNGPAGNVGSETITYVVFREVTGGMGKLQPRNPLPAVGGTSPEPIADVKLYAPNAFRDTLERAVTADDYSTLAGDNTRRLLERPTLVSAALAAVQTQTGMAPPGTPPDNARAGDDEEEGSETAPLPPDLCLIPFERLQKARCTLRWTGSWYEAQVAIDPLGQEGADSELCDEIDAYLEPYRRVGHDLAVKPAIYAPLDIALSICVAPNVLTGHVESALLAVFSDRVLPDGTLGFFHPDNLTFGSAVYASQIVALAQGAPGVTEVRLIRLARYQPGTPPAPETFRNKHPGPWGGVPAGGLLALAPYEIPTLDNDPSSPGKGRLTLYFRGGR
ncbi:MAG TPA: hypothetical protein VGG48_09095 [Rhizomicrobium sp.]|jgi:hypothetical protein